MTAPLWDRRVKGNLLWVALLLMSVGCSAYRSVNTPVTQIDVSQRLHPLTKSLSSQRPEEIVIVLALSGGGTRAAAFSYGVLQELRDTSIGQGATKRRLLDEVDTISSVSGGSFTSAYYGLFGDRIFDDFEDRFLKKNVQGRLFLGLLRPMNWFRMASTFFDRNELAIEYYDRTIFEGKTFADLYARNGPLIMINATDLSQGNRFAFDFDHFHPICSDLLKMKVSRAVTASSAVPVLFNPVTIKNFAGTCHYEPPAWVQDALTDTDSPRRAALARAHLGYLDAKKRPYVHLVDGGISDNLGIRGPLNNFIDMGSLQKVLHARGLRSLPRHLVVIVVNAYTKPDSHVDLSAVAPSLSYMMNSVTSVQIGRYNFETIELLRQNLHSLAESVKPPEQAPNTYLIEVSFDAIVDPTERNFFNNVPTSFKLDDNTVDRLKEAGRRLLRESKEYQALLAEIQQDQRP